jgi:signal transduction histidine kinase
MTRRTDFGGASPTGSEGSCDQLYWNRASDLLFAVRPLGAGRFTYAAINPAFEAVLGISSRNIGKLDVFDYMGAEDARLIRSAFQACLAQGSEVRVRHGLAFGGSRHDTETATIPVIDPGGGVRLIGSHRILRKELFDDAPGEDDIRRAVSLASIQEDIHQRLASELHDSTCQHLIAASLGLMRIRAHLGASVNAERLCDEIDASIGEALKEIRSFTYLRYPQALTVDGLKTTIECYARSFATRTSLDVSTNIMRAVDRLPKEHQRLLLRVTQEALTNVFRHAKATKVKIVIEATDIHIRLMISDNGCGLVATRSGHSVKAISTGVGIPTMSARLKQIGGRLEIHSNPAVPHSGTTVYAVFAHGFTTKVRKRKAVATAKARTIRHKTQTLRANGSRGRGPR